MKNRFLFICATVFVVAWIAGCGQDPSATDTPPAATAAETSPEGTILYADSVAWAVNVGGGEHLGIDGVEYQGDEAGIGGEVGQINKMLGSQDSLIYKSYRAGDLEISRPLANGSYDITFFFAEPDDIAVGDRVFDVIAEEQVVLDDLDVRLARDNKHQSALSFVVTEVEVNDGQLDIRFEASAGEPLLSALVVRKKITDPRDWELVWYDEFDYEGALDTTKWNYNIWPARKVNDEDQAYTDRERNVRVEGGNLILEAHKEAYDNAEYTSGRVHSDGKGDLLYGRVEVRARIPAGQGTWSAIWMLPSDPYKYATTCSAPEDWQGSATCDAWPNSGEIDIMEHVGYDMHTIWGTVHNKAYYWINWEQRKGGVQAKAVDEMFHVYSLEWTPERIDIFYNGSRYFTYFNEGTGWRAWPYDHPYHVILNLAIGGAWGRSGGPIDDSIFPVRMEVDYVRVFKQSNMAANE